MKKNYLYIALGLMGIMGALLIGVVDATATVTLHPENVINYTLNGNENFTAGTITLQEGNKIITILDRNLGAGEAGTGDCEDPNSEGICYGEGKYDPTYGYHFQWGNNHGFKPCSDSKGCKTFPNGEITGGQSTVSVSYGINYSNPVFRVGNHNWHRDDTIEYWWGGYSSDRWGGSWQVNNGSARQGPCPKNFHVPSLKELETLMTMVGNDVAVVRNKLLIPFAGYRSYNDASMYYAGRRTGLWSSTATNNSSSSAKILYVYGNPNMFTGDASRAQGYSVRCFYNKYEAYTPPIFVHLNFNVDTNGGTDTTTSSTEVESGEIVILGSYTGTKDGWDFVGWNIDPDAEAGLPSLTITQNTTLYAIFSKTIEATFSKDDTSVQSIDNVPNTCKMYNKASTCSINLPSVTCKAGYHSPSWTDSTINISSDVTTTVSCTECPTGYTSDAGASTQSECYISVEAGKNISTANSSEQTSCLAGTYKSAHNVNYGETSSCDVCQGRDKYSAAGSPSCTTVDNGYYTTGCDEDNNKCTGQSQCTEGTACENGVQTNCVASSSTQAGTYSSTAGATSCTTASDGHYVATNNAISETQCTAGNYCVDGKIIACTTLGSEYTSDAGASSQNDCYKTLTATFNANGATSVSSGSITCKKYYGSDNCSITTPTITLADEFEALGFNTLATDTGSTISQNTSLNIVGGEEYYAITKSLLPIKITFDINGNGGATSTGECYKYNGSGSCSVTSPDITPADGFIVIGWNADSATHTSQWNTGTVETVSSSTTYYAQSEKAGYQVTASYTVGTGVSAYSNTPNTCDVEKVYNGASYTACNITLPTLTLRLGYNTGVWSTGTQIENPGAVINLLADETYTASATPNDDTQYLVHYYQHNLSGAYDLFETYTGAGTTDTIATAVEKTYSGFAFSGTNTNNKLTGNIDGDGSLELKLYYDRSEYKLSFVVDGNVIQSGTVAYAAAITAPADPTKDCNAFAGWFSSVAGVTTAGTMPDSDVTFTANWNYTCSRSSGGGGGGRTTSPIDVVNETLDNNVQNTTDEKENGENVDNVDNVDNTEGNKSGETVYSDEFKEAYEFAHSQGITTMPTIQQADMESPLTRIAMAKMLSYYAINVLGQKPDTSKTIKFKDVSNKLNTQYDNGVILAYQLGIMGINMPKNRFRPNDPVTRGEFGTALSRMLYKIADGKKKYYSTHLAKLMEEKIITNDNPNMKELRGYVMIMLKRSAENK